MNDDDKLKALNEEQMPAPSEAARQRALAAAMLAFDAAQENSQAAPKGADWNARLSSIIQRLRGNWFMDTRFTLGLGTATVALLLLPLGYQLYLSTAMTPVGPTSFTPSTPVLDGPPVEVAGAKPVPMQPTTTIGNVGRTEESRLAVTQAAPTNAPREQAEMGLSDGEADLAVAPEPAASVANRSAADGMMKQQAESYAAPTMSAEAVAAMPAPTADMGAGLPADPAGNEFTDFDESPVHVVAEEPVSTFSIDVDTASYSYVRRMLNDGYMPEADAVRIEELINYFDYDYRGPDSAATPFQSNMQVYPTPWNPDTQLLQIGLQGYVPPVTTDPAANLTFLIDTSGSMDEPDKLPLLKRAFSLLVDQLTGNDKVSIVVYAGSAGVVLDATSATDKQKILGALENLWAGGSTAGAEGIELAYKINEQNRIAGGVNRIILATDGDFNVGIADPDQLIDLVKAKRDGGTFLSVLGFGSGNYQDDTAQALAQNGNGNAAYIDSFREAQKVLVAEAGGTLVTIAQDVKIQVEFNPAVVSEYRLIGYETRALNREDFNNDKVDAGDIGAGHTVTALYEITPVGSDATLVDPLRYGTDTPAMDAGPSDEIGFLRIRYKAPEGTVSELIETPIPTSLAVDTVAAASVDARWAAAVAAFAQKLKGSDYGGSLSWDEIRTLAQGARGEDADGYRAEFMQLINAAETLTN
jgi:Ca-activated chloride channel family protein